MPSKTGLSAILKSVEPAAKAWFPPDLTVAVLDAIGPKARTHLKAIQKTLAANPYAGHRSDA